MRSKPKGAKYRNLTEPSSEEIESMARENAGEPYRGPLIALVDEVRRLRALILEGSCGGC